MDIRELIEEAECLRELLDEHIESLRGCVNSDHPNHPAKQAARDGLTAVHPSGARNSTEHEADDVLPVGRLRHTPYQRFSAKERREFALEVLERARRGGGDPWVVPLWYAEQHYMGSGAIRYFAGALRTEFKALLEEGFVDVRATGKRGARYKYKLKTMTTTELQRARAAAL